MPTFSSRSFCYGFILAICLSYVAVFYLINSDVLKTGAQSDITKLKHLIRSREAIPPRAINLNERRVAFDPVDPDFIEQLKNLVRDHKNGVPVEVQQEERDPVKTEVVPVTALRTIAPEPVKPKTETKPVIGGVTVLKTEGDVKPLPDVVPSESQKDSNSNTVASREAAPAAVKPSVKPVPKEAYPTSKNWTHIHWHDYMQSNASSIPWVDYMSKNLVLGIAVNTNPKNFAIFAASFRQYSPLGEAMVFVNSPVSERHWLIAEEHKIRLIEFEPKALHPKYIRSYHPSSQRWILFHRLLHSNNHHVFKEFNKVIMVDIRDTAFQANPFDLISGTKDQFYVFAEQPGLTIESCGWNSGWIKSCFGEGALTSVQINPILCSGISMGSMDRAAVYIKQMHDTLMGESSLTKLFPLCERNGVDQGVHNYIVHARAFNVTQVMYEHNFPVVNAQAYDTLPVYDFDPATLRSATNVKYAIVHQYDRISALQLGLAKKYVKWVDMNNPKAEWDVEESCKSYVPVYDSDLFRGKCDYGSERSMSPASCCQACENKNILARETQATQPPGVVPAAGEYPEDVFCTGFTFANGVCYLKRCRRDDVVASSKNKAELGKQSGAVTAYRALPETKSWF